MLDSVDLCSFGAVIVAVSVCQRLVIVAYSTTDGSNATLNLFNRYMNIQLVFRPKGIVLDVGAVSRSKRMETRERLVP